ncbi:MAG: DUF4395 domain-containing protein [Cyclobacteriaceae bacterium]|nr:DUF4395 domain-containing protein [Cyclobacteriaceae bacterium]
MTHKSKIIQFGETVEGYNIPVLNEREVRAAAGISFVFMLIALLLIIMKGNFLLIKYTIILFLTDMLIRVYINPKYSPMLILGRLIVSRQNPEYVGAPQKRFAWKIGVAFASFMLVLMVILNSYSVLSGLTCLFCLAFLFFESAFGICLGCLVYAFFYKDKVQYCPGEICDVKNKQEIQRTSAIQLLILSLFVVLVVTLVMIFNEEFKRKPTNLWQRFSTQVSTGSLTTPTPLG